MVAALLTGSGDCHAYSPTLAVASASRQPPTIGAYSADALKRAPHGCGFAYRLQLLQRSGLFASPVQSLALRSLLQQAIDRNGLLQQTPPVLRSCTCSAYFFACAHAHTLPSFKEGYRVKLTPVKYHGGRNYKMRPPQD